MHRCPCSRWNHGRAAHLRFSMESNSRSEDLLTNTGSGKAGNNLHEASDCDMENDGLCSRMLGETLQWLCLRGSAEECIDGCLCGGPLGAAKA